MRRTVINAVMGIFVAMALCLAGCGGGGDGGSPSAGGNTPSIVGTWQTSNYPQANSGQFVFNANATFSSVFKETATTTSSGTYTYSNNTLALHYVQSTNVNLTGTTETFNNVTITGNQLSANNTIFIKQ